MLSFLSNIFIENLDELNEGIKYFDFAQIEDFLKIRNHVLYSIREKLLPFLFFS